jgi:hypothetical protein
MLQRDMAKEDALELYQMNFCDCAVNPVLWVGNPFCGCKKALPPYHQCVNIGHLDLPSLTNTRKDDKILHFARETFGLIFLK